MNNIKLFESKQIRSVWNDEEEKWYFSIVDVMEALTGSPNPRKYWSVLKTRLKAEGSQLATNCSQLKLQSADGKFYKTDVADTEQLLRLIQSIPSPKAEPFYRRWSSKKYHAVAACCEQALQPGKNTSNTNYRKTSSASIGVH